MFDKVKKIWANLFKDYLANNNIFTVGPPKMVEPPTETPLTPYFVPFCSDPFYEKQLISKYEQEGRPMTPETYKKAFNDHISVRAFLNEKKTGVLLKIWKDAMHLKTILEPLHKAGIEYTLDLTGGSVRDFVLNRQNLIKDLDFMLSISKFDGYSPNLRNGDFFSSQELDAVGWPKNVGASLKYDLHINPQNYNNQDGEPNVSLEELKVKLVELCFNRIKEKIQVFNHATKRKEFIGSNRYGEEMFREDRLISVFKMDGTKTNYPIDILLTDFAKPAFLKDFDFDLCKASFCFINPHVKKEFPKNHSHLISRFVAEKEFWADVINQKITYDSKLRSQYQMSVSFDSHLPRIEAKYPGYKAMVIGDGEERELADKQLLAHDLKTDLSQKQEEAPKKRLKL